MSIFDRLKQQLDIQKREQGISALDIADLPPNLRKIMRMMLREVVMKHTELVAALETMPAASRMTQAELDAALKTLVEQNWLVRYGSDELMSFKVNLRRRAGSQLGQDIWSALGDRIANSKKEGAPKENNLQ